MCDAESKVCCKNLLKVIVYLLLSDELISCARERKGIGNVGSKQ